MFSNVLFSVIKKFKKISGTGNFVSLSERNAICRNIKKDREQTNDLEVMEVYFKNLWNFTVEKFYFLESRIFEKTFMVPSFKLNERLLSANVP